jgi:hypothetical protein
MWLLSFEYSDGTGLFVPENPEDGYLSNFAVLQWYIKARCWNCHGWSEKAYRDAPKVDGEPMNIPPGPPFASSTGQNPCQGSAQPNQPEPHSGESGGE